VTERQQLAEAIIAAHKSFDDSGRWSWKDYGEHMAAAVEPFLMAAERAGYERVEKALEEVITLAREVRVLAFAEGYERCKRDASTRIKARRQGEHTDHYLVALDDALAVVAALNATQVRGASPSSEDKPSESRPASERGSRTDAEQTGLQGDAVNGPSGSPAPISYDDPMRMIWEAWCIGGSRRGHDYPDFLTAAIEWGTAYQREQMAALNATQQEAPCAECGGRGIVMVESGVIGPEGQREMPPEPCGCPAGEREFKAWQAESQRQLATQQEAERPPADFWHEVPCGHPPDPVAWMGEDGAACHCGRLLNGDPTLPGPDTRPDIQALVACQKCGCYVGIPATQQEASDV